MAKWDETTGRSTSDDHLLTDDDLARCARADVCVPRSAIPTQVVSNGEYAPLPQTTQQKRVQARVDDLTAAAAKKLGVSRRAFLAGTGGIAASFVAMNEVFGPFFDIDPLSLLVPEAFAQSAPPRDLFVFDDQLHMVRRSRYSARRRCARSRKVRARQASNRIR